MVVAGVMVRKSGVASEKCSFILSVTSGALVLVVCERRYDCMYCFGFVFFICKNGQYYPFC